jgi:hypothetical protein
VTADAGALAAVDAACDICRDVAEQQFNRGTATVRLDGTGTDALLLKQLPVLNAGTVTVNGGTITDYVVDDNGILLRGTAGSDPRPVWPSGRRNVAVTYEHGYDNADIPRSVRIVALSIASRLIVQGPASEEQVGDVRIKYAAASTDLTTGEKLILGKYKQIR